MHRERSRRVRIIAASGAMALSFAAAPAAAPAQGEKPTVVTGGATAVTQTTARIIGFVHPHNTTATYFFQYGTDALYSARTPATVLPKGNRRVRVVADLTGLTPARTYHYRLIARNVHGLVRGKDRTFRTPRQPLGFTLTATPNPVPFGSATTITGTLSGTGSGSREVYLQASTWPYSAGFVNQGNAQVTDAAGNFAFPVLSVPLNTQYRIITASGPVTASNVLAVAVNVAVRTRVRVRRATVVRGKARVRFRGRIRPARDGARVFIQRLRRGTWRTIGRTTARHATASYSRYRRTLRIRKGGTFRVWAEVADGSYASNNGRAVRLRLRHR